MKDRHRGLEVNWSIVDKLYVKFHRKYEECAVEGRGVDNQM